ncbi:MAG: phage holin family protein [Patescibacteria group bacterium]
MHLISLIVFSVFSNAFAILGAAYFVPGFEFRYDFLGLLAVAGIFTAINIVIKPVLKMIFGLFLVLTMGLFSVVINAFGLYLLDFLSPSVTINGLLALFYATLIVSAANILINFAAKSLFKK